MGQFDRLKRNLNNNFTDLLHLAARHRAYVKETPKSKTQAAYTQGIMAAIDTLVGYDISDDDEYKKMIAFIERQAEELVKADKEPTN